MIRGDERRNERRLRFCGSFRQPGGRGFGGAQDVVHRGRSDGLHSRDKAVALPGDGLHVGWLFGRIAQNLPQLVNGGVHAGLEVHERIFRPQAQPHGFARHGFAGIFQQGDEHLVEFFLELYAHSVLEKRLALEVEVKFTELDIRRGKNRFSRGNSFSF